MHFVGCRAALAGNIFYISIKDLDLKNGFSEPLLE